MQEEAGYRKTAANVFVRHTSFAAAEGPYSDRGHERHASGTSSSLPSYHSPTRTTPTASVPELTGPWAVLGERLNLEKDEVRELIANNAAKYAFEGGEEGEGRAYELPVTGGRH